MSSKDFIKSLVSNKIYQRGINYYNIGRVLQYRINKKKANHYQISARVSGTKKYQVQTEIKLKRKGIEVESSCDCPYNWEEFCKHEVAVLYKFMEEDFRSPKVKYEAEADNEEEISVSDFPQKQAVPNIVQQRLADRSFNKLKEIAKL
jgi:uncharacterized Zn finger protein